jgi:hypothetical protein
MTVIELKEALEQMPDEAEVRLAMQPSWPFEYSIMEVVPLEPDEEAPADEEVKVVYLTEGSQLGYLPGEASEAIGW